MIDICCVRTGVKYHSFSYWSIVMTSLVEFSTGEFRAKQVLKVLESGITNQEKNQGLLESLVKIASSLQVKAMFTLYRI